MPFDGSPRYLLEIAAADKTAAAFSSVERRLKSLQANQTAMAQSMTAIGNGAQVAIGKLKGLAAAYLSVEAAKALFGKALTAGDLGEQAQQLGVNSDQLQAYRLVAVQAGMSVEQMDTALVKLAKTMGDAAEGGKDQIAFFDKFKIKLLDAKGELRPVADVLPELARGLQGVGSSTQKTADEMTAFGRAGARIDTMLGDLAAGNEALIASGRKENAIISAEAIEKWDKLGDRMAVANQRWDALVAEFGADVALPAVDLAINKFEDIKRELVQIGQLWRAIVGAVDSARSQKIFAGAAPAAADRQNLQDRLDALNQNKGQFGYDASKKALEAQLAAFDEAEKRAKALAAQSEMQHQEEIARRQKLPAMVPPLGVNSTPGGSVGVGSPGVKGAGAAEAAAYQKIVDGAKDYIEAKKAEAVAVGMSISEGQRYIHFTELMNKATDGNKQATKEQKDQLLALADGMAKADEALATAKFMDDFKKKSDEFVASQEAEYEALFMGAEAATAYKVAQQALNDAKAKGVELSAAQRSQIQTDAEAQAAIGMRVKQTGELLDVGRDAVQGFFSDIRQGAQEGKSALEIFESSFLNMLNKIADKLISMAVNNLVDQALGGKGGGGGGILGSLGGWFGGLLGFGGGGVTAGAAPTGGYGGFPGYAGTLPGFAGGGDTPAYRPFMVGEDGPEIMWSRTRGHVANRKQLGGMRSPGVSVVVNNNYASGAQVSTKASTGADGAPRLEIIVEQIESSMAGRMARGQGTLSKTMQGLYGPPIAR